MSGQPLLPNTVEAGEVAKPHGDGVVGRGGRMGALGNDEEIFGGVLSGDEFENFGFVAGPLEEQGAERIGHELGLTFLKDSMAKSVGEHGGSNQLGTNFLLAAGGNDQQAGPGVEAESERVIGGGITGVEGNEHVGDSSVSGF